ncbi:Uncharacterised protein [Klebsiella pneumoniae]|nr:Uncharacterised protein [Klebsiella pneumoniae]
MDGDWMLLMKSIMNFGVLLEKLSKVSNQNVISWGKSGMKVCHGCVVINLIH